MLAFLWLSRENRWSSKSHHACMFGRVATEVNTVKIRPMGQIIWRIISKAQIRRNGSRAERALTSVSLFSSLGNRSKTSVPVILGRRAGGIGELDVSRLGRRRSGGRLAYRQRQRGIVDLDVGCCTTALCGMVFSAEDSIDQPLARRHSHRHHQQEEPVKKSPVLFHTLMVIGYSAAKVVNISETTK